MLETLRDRWRGPALSILLGVQCLTIFGLVPATAVVPWIPQSVVALLPLIFSSIVIVTSRGIWTLYIGAAALMLSAAVAVMEHWQVDATALVGEECAAIVTFGLLSTVVFEAVYGPGHFTGHRVRGAVVLYLNIGLLFTVADRLVNAVCPNAYLHLPDAGHQLEVRAALEYFSFSNLTSLGIGDITPVHPIARAMCVLETTIGQLFPATLLAMAVTRAVAERNKPGES